MGDSYIANNADDNTPYACKKDIKTLIETIERYYANNALKPNFAEYHLMLSSIDKDIFVMIEGKNIFNSSENKLLGITFDNITITSEYLKSLMDYLEEGMEEVFSVKRNIKYCSKFIFNSRNIRTVRYGTETLSYIGPKL